MIPTQIIAERIVDRLEPTLSHKILNHEDSGNFEIELGHKQFVARRERMIKIVKEEIDNALRTSMLR